MARLPGSLFDCGAYSTVYALPLLLLDDHCALLLRRKQRNASLQLMEVCNVSELATKGQIPKGFGQPIRQTT